MIYLVSNNKQLFMDFALATMQEMLEWAKVQSVLSIDTETSGLFDFTNRLYTFQIGNPDDQFVLDMSNVSLEFLKPLLEGDTLKLFHNYQFDGLFLFHHNIRVKNLWDTQLAEMCLTNGLNPRELSLAALAQRICQKTLNKSQRSKINGDLTYGTIVYAAEDVEVLETIYKDQYQRATNIELLDAIRLQNRYVQVIVEKKYKGIKLSVDKVNVLSETLSKNILESRQKTDEAYAKISPYPVQTSMFFSNTGINWNAPKQVGATLKSLGVNIVYENKESVGEGVLKIATKNVSKEVKHLVELYLNYKQQIKLKSTYTNSYLKFINKVTGRIHPDFWQILDTYRTSSSNPSIMNIPARSEIGRQLRACFIPEEGNVFVNADFSAQEPRVLADKCQDPSLIEFFNSGGGDIHSMVASKMFTVIYGKPTVVTKDNENKELRQTGKVLNLKLDYGGSAYTVKDDLGVSQQEAQKFIDALAQAFPYKEKYFKNVIKDALATGYILFNPVTKAKYFIPEYKEYLEIRAEVAEYLAEQLPVSKKMWSKLYTLKGAIERKCKNYPIQATSSDITKLAAVYVLDDLYRYKINDAAWIVNEVHDEIIVECKEALAEKVSKILKVNMIKAGKVFCPTVPMEVEPEINLYWKK